MAAQLDMWDTLAKRQGALTEIAPANDVVVCGGHSLRPYQEEGVAKVISRLEEDRSTLLVLPTGGGKTRVATELVQRRGKDRVLFLAHRDELLQQARQRLTNDTGELVGLDQADFYGGEERLMVGSVQTVSMQRRLERWDPKRFDLIIVDEAHHATSPTYRRVLDYFIAAKVVGLTATPDRADEKAMGQVFDSVAFVYEIEDAIRDGFLCDVACTRIQIAGLDLSAVKTTAGDLNQGQLDQIMAVESVMQGIADATIREAGERKTVLFTTSVENAHRLAEIMCRHRKGCARAIDGGTNIDERRAILRGHQAGDFQFLTNVGICTEGYDDPSIACIAMARPTKSRAFYAQCVGRGLRIASGKRDCLILDFYGNSGRHRLCGPVDILGGNYTDEEEELAERMIEQKPGMRAREALDAAKAKLLRDKQLAEDAARRASVRARAIYTKQGVDPFSTLHLDVDEERRTADRFGGKPPTQKQLDCLAKFKIPTPEGLTSQLAGRLITAAIARANKHLATFKQVSILEKYNIPGALNMRFETASRVIDAIVQAGWRTPSSEKLSRAMGADF